jgi:hypothetical protein
VRETAIPKPDRCNCRVQFIGDFGHSLVISTVSANRVAKPSVHSVPSLSLAPILKLGLGTLVEVRWRCEDADDDLGEALIHTDRSGTVLAGEGQFLDFGRMYLEETICADAAGAAGQVRRLLCSRCGEGCGIIYFADAAWACRRCHGLAYPTQSLSKTNRLKAKLDTLIEQEYQNMSKREWARTKNKRRDAIFRINSQLSNREISAPSPAPPKIITYLKPVSE